MLPKGSATGSDSRSTAALLLLDVAGARSYMKDLHQSYTKLLRERTAMHDTISRLQRRLALALQAQATGTDAPQQADLLADTTQVQGAAAVAAAVAAATAAARQPIVQEQLRALHEENLRLQVQLKQERGDRHHWQQQHDLLLGMFRRHQTLSEIEADLSELPTPPASDTMPPQDQSASTGYNGTLHDASEDSAEDSSCSSTAAHTMQQQHPRGAQLIASAASEPDVWLRATNATAAAAHRHNPCRSAARRDAVPAGRGSYTAEYKDSSAQRRHSSRVRQQLFVGPHDQQPPGHLQHSHAGRAAEPQTAFIQPGSNNQHAVNAGYQRSKHQHMAGASHPRNSSKQAPTSISYSLPANDGAAVQRQHGRSGAFTQHIEVHATGNRAFRGSSPDEGSMAVDMPHYLTHGRAKQPSWRQSSTATGLHSGMPRSWQQLQQACTAAVAQEHHGASIAAKQGRGTNRSHAQWTCRNSSPSASSGSDLAGCSSHEGDESSWEEDNESLSQAQPPSVAQSHSSMLVSNQKTRTDEWQQQQQHQQHEQQQDNEQQTAGFGSQAPSSTTRYVFASSHQYVVADLASTAAEDPAATGQTAARRDVGAMPEQSPAVAQGQPQGTPSFSQLQAQLASKLQQLQAQLQEDEPAAAHEVRTGAQQKHIAASPARPPMPRPAPARRAASPMPVQQRAQHLEARVGHLHSEMSGMCRGKVAQLAAGRQWSLGGKAAV